MSRWLSFLARVERLTAALASRPKLAIGVVVLAALLECVTFAALRWPVPFVADEFSHLLAAETFASGRLTNPPHFLRHHLESMSVLQEPTYQSKYPPAQGLVLAFGLVVAKHALVGVWLSFALACGAVVWMLQAWVPPRWALFGGLLVVLNPIVLEYGSQYIGGAPAMLGGALLFGSLRRLLSAPRLALAAPLAAGVWLLAVSRPVEGLVASVPAALVIAVWVVREWRSSRGAAATRIVLWTGLLLALGFAWLGYYHYRVTGSPLVMPYQLHMARNSDLNFVWDASAAAGLSVMAAGVLGNALYLFGILAKVLGPVSLGAAILLLLVAVVQADRWAAFALLTFGTTLGVASLTAGGDLRYLAPVVPLFFLLTTLAARSVWTRLDRATVLRPMVAIAFLSWQGYYQLRVAFLWHATGFEELTYRDYGWIYDRARLVAPLEQGAGQYLIMVRTDPDAGPSELSNWVYNGPNIDTQKVVWAWEQRDPAPLFDYFNTREAWLLDLRNKPLLLERAFRKDPQWTLKAYDAGTARLVQVPDPDRPGLVRIEIGDGGGEPRKVQVERGQPSVQSGASYTVSFRGRALSPLSVGVQVSQAHPPWGNLGFSQEVALNSEWQTFDFQFNATQDDAVVRLVFDIRSPGSFELSNAALAPAGRR